MGLLDSLNSDDALMGMALLSAASPKPVRTGIGEGLLQARQLVQAERMAREDRAIKQRMMALQEQQLMGQLQAQQAQQEEAARARANEEAFRKLIPSPQMSAAQDALAVGGGPTMANASRMAPVDPMAQMQFEALRLGQIKPMDYINAQRKDTNPMKLGAGEALIDPRTFKPLFTNPKEDTTPSAIKEYNYAVAQGYKGSFQQYQLEQKRAGATSVAMSVNAVKPLVQGVAESLAQQVGNDLSGAKAAGSTIENARKLSALVDSGSIVTGPLADQRIVARQVAEAIGVGGKTNAEVLSNTRQAIQSMAQFELDAAQSMKGQGQITEAERAILKRAAAGDINMTGPELKSLSATLETRARKRIEVHQSNVGRLAKIPGTEPLIPMLSVEQPPAPQEAPARVRRFNPATGRIE